jgi:hypothetical protein
VVVEDNLGRFEGGRVDPEARGGDPYDVEAAGEKKSGFWLVGTERFWGVKMERWSGDGDRNGDGDRCRCRGGDTGDDGESDMVDQYLDICL